MSDCDCDDRDSYPGDYYCNSGSCFEPPKFCEGCYEKARSPGPVDQQNLIAACRRLIALVDNPEPGLATWHMLCLDNVTLIRRFSGGPA